jgi:hypothetical protein
VDPLGADAERRVRFDVLRGIGDEAIAVVERRDTANGITQDAALIVVRRGTWQADHDSELVILDEVDGGHKLIINATPNHPWPTVKAAS